MQFAAFNPMGKTVAVVTNATPNTSSNATVNLYNTTADGLFTFATLAAGLGLAAPTAVRINNQGTSPVFLSFNQGARTAVVAVAGTPQLELPVMANTVEVFSGLQWAPGNPPTIIVATICPGGASQPLYLTFGEGM